MQANDDSTRILRSAAWIWIGFLIGMAVMDSILYLPQIQRMAAQPILQAPQTLPPRNPRPFGILMPVLLFYTANGLMALLFLFFAHWRGIKAQMGRMYYPMMALIISTAPILINVLVVPRFPQGPLSNAEGMALRQLPVLFVALALVAWEFKLEHIIFFSVATAALELSLIALDTLVNANLVVFLFIAIIRSISFIAVGIFISALVTQLREANANLTHYASTREQLAVSRERNRLARELHDTLAHSLTALSVSLETVKAYFDIDLEKTRELIDTSLAATRKGVDDTRRALRALRSSDLEDLGLRLAIQKIAMSAASRFALDLELDLQDPMPSLSPDMEQTIFRITQEAVENITKHSQAQKFSIHLSNNGPAILIIQDDGIGFDRKSKEATGHFGMVGMRERADLAGGQLKIESEPGRGTTMVLKI
jgi:signal transduction histidine kinase